MTGKSRREVLALGAGTAALALTGEIGPAAATPQEAAELIARFTGGKTAEKGRISIDLPEIAENGNTVPLTITVDSPMTATDRVKAIHLFNQKNPQPNVIGARLSPRAGKAQLSTRIKLADAQTIVAVAELSDGSFWSGDADVIVTIAACVEDLQ